MRADNSCYHVVCYDTANGSVLARETAQGYSDNSAWSRGQSWGIYGFTVCYRETHDAKFLTAARKTADFYLNHKRPGYVPGIRSKAREGQSPEFRDASTAAAIQPDPVLFVNKPPSTQIKKDHIAVILSGVGVDGLEPPTLCL